MIHKKDVSLDIEELNIYFETNSIYINLFDANFDEIFKEQYEVIIKDFKKYRKTFR